MSLLENYQPHTLFQFMNAFYTKFVFHEIKTQRFFNVLQVKFFIFSGAFMAGKLIFCINWIKLGATFYLVTVKGLSVNFLNSLFNRWDFGEFFFFIVYEDSYIHSNSPFNYTIFLLPNLNLSRLTSLTGKSDETLHGYANLPYLMDVLKITLFCSSVESLTVCNEGSTSILLSNTRKIAMRAL